MYTIDIFEYKIVYTGDFNLSEDHFLPQSSIPSGSTPDLLLCESTYGNVNYKAKDIREKEVKDAICNTLNKNGKVLISEYPNNVEPVPDNFPIRNRIIAGLSQAVLVTEADKRSGTSITVNYALASGRDVFAVPHHAHKCSLCNLLIKDGAKLVEHGEDINDEFNKYQFDGEKNLKDNL